MENQKYILIAGSSSSLGKELATSLCAQNFKLILCARNKESLDQLRNIYQNKKHLYYLADLSDEKTVKNLCAELKNLNIKLSGVVFTSGQHQMIPIKFSSKKNYVEIFENNFFSTSILMSHIDKLILDGASIIVTGSAATIRGGVAASAYIAAKSALEGYVKSAALEFASRNVRINIILPGVFKSDMTNTFLNKVGDQKKLDIIKRHPLGLGEVCDVTNVIEFLLSPKAKWITGQSIVIDGGFSINI